MKIAIAHDFLFQYGGAEKVVEKWLEMYPNAVIYTSFLIPEKFNSSPVFVKAIADGRIKTTFVQKFFELSWATKFQKHLFWLYPLAMKTHKLIGYDTVLISSTDCGKQIQIEGKPKILHYCHSPVRYLHGLTTEVDHNQLSKIQRFVISLVKPFLRKLDLGAMKYLQSKNAILVANSNFIKDTIKAVYGQTSTVVYPPIETKVFANNPRNPSGEEFYLSHGRISFHKRIDLAILACLERGARLKIEGISARAEEMEQLQKIVVDWERENPNQISKIEFLGRTSDEVYFENLKHCKAFLFPGKEDFGIAPVEVLAAGVPVIAYKAGGALEYVVDITDKNTVGGNGVFFAEQTQTSLQTAISEFELVQNWDEQFIRNSAIAFDTKTFENQIKNLTA